LGTKVCRYNWHSAGSLGWSFPMLEYFSNKIYGSNFIKSNSTRKQSWFEISKMLTAVLKDKFTALFIMIFGTLSFPMSLRASVRV